MPNVASAANIATLFAAPSQRFALLFGWAALVAVLMSTEFLFQPFIWRNFTFDQIGLAWLAIARDRLVVALTIAVALGVAGRPRFVGLWRFTPYLTAVVVGAVAGEALLSWLTPQEDRQDLISWFGRILRWSVVGGAIAGMLHFWRSGAELAAAAEESLIQEAQARRLAASTQLEALRRQIEPHFLFNTLATIRRLHETDPDQGQQLLGRLFQYMSATLGEASTQRATLSDEISLVCAYLDVCASRMSGRLIVHTQVEPGLESLDFPPMVLATLAENAVKHGVFPQNGGVIAITAHTLGDMVEVSLSDDGVGLSGEGGGGMGLANIVGRLRLLYGPGAGLQLRENHPHGVCATLRIPAPPGRRR